MALGDLTDPQAVLDAIAEFDRVGRDAFLEKYGFGEAVSYFVVHSDILYDSKAIAGAAHSYQFGQPLTNTEFSGGDLTVAAKLESLGFQVTRPGALPWSMEIGEITTRGKVAAAYGGASQGGIESSSTTPNVFIYTDPSSGTEHGYNYDGWDPDEPTAFYYTGDGQKGPQEFVGGNKSIMDAAQRGRTLRLFEAVDGKHRPGGKLQRYLGAFQLDQEHPYRLEPAPGPDGVMRQVIVFHLIGEDGGERPSESASGYALQPKREVKVISTESSKTDEYEVPPHEGSVAIRRESKLVGRFKAHLEAQGSSVVREEIPIPNERNSMYTDLHDVTEERLYEAKSSVDRATIRLAAGQLLDYLRFLPKTEGFLLLPSEPSKDLVAFIHSCGFGLVYESEDEWIERRRDGS
jgi:hypothetical protein